MLDILNLEQAYKSDLEPVRKKLNFVNLLKEEFSAYEDAGAFLKAYIDYRQGKVSYPIISLFEYKPKYVILSRLLSEYGISSSQELFNLLKLDEWIPSAWEQWFPHLNLKKSLMLACSFFYDDCKKNQAGHSVAIYNKIKHGPLVVPSGKLYMPDSPDSPAVLIQTDAKDPNVGINPYTLCSFVIDDNHIEERYKVIEFVQCNLRLFAALYVIWRYPNVLSSRGIAEPKELFERNEFKDVCHLICEVTSKK